MTVIVVLRRFEQLCDWVREELPVKEAILDGEVVALDSEGRQNFRDLLGGVTWVKVRCCAKAVQNPVRLSNMASPFRS